MLSLLHSFFRTGSNIKHLLAKAECVLIACKPQQLEELEKALSPLTKHKLVISILNSVPLHRLATRFPQASGLVQAIPNTPCQVEAGTTVYAVREPLTKEDNTLLHHVLGSTAKTFLLPEAQIDSAGVTSGCGPAYFLEFLIALGEAAIKMGIEPEMARDLIRDTFVGTAALSKKSH